MPLAFEPDVVSGALSSVRATTSPFESTSAPKLSNPQNCGGVWPLTQPPVASTVTPSSRASVVAPGPRSGPTKPLPSRCPTYCFTSGTSPTAAVTTIPFS